MLHWCDMENNLFELIEFEFYPFVCFYGKGNDLKDASLDLCIMCTVNWKPRVSQNSSLKTLQQELGGGGHLHLLHWQGIYKYDSAVYLVGHLVFLAWKNYSI